MKSPGNVPPSPIFADPRFTRYSRAGGRSGRPDTEEEVKEERSE